MSDQSDSGLCTCGNCFICGYDDDTHDDWIDKDLVGGDED